MTILRNSAKCVYCGIEISSTHVHDFNVHYCKMRPKQAKKWEGDKLVDVPGETTWNFAVDGGREYIRRCGSGYVDTSEVTDDHR